VELLIAVQCSALRQRWTDFLAVGEDPEGA